MRHPIALPLCCAILFMFQGCGGSGGSTPPPQIFVTVSPSTAAVNVAHAQQFTATVTGTTNTSVTWTVAGGPSNGTIATTGLYTAPASVPNPATVTVTATSQANPAKSATATVTVQPGVVSVPSVTVSPNPASVAAFATQQFSASVSSLSNTAVTWQVNGTPGGSKQFGFISSTGLYVAPGAVPTKSNGQGDSITTTATVTAVPQADSSVSGSSTVTVSPTNQNLQNGAIALGTSGGNQKDSQTSGGTITCCSGTLGSLVTRGGTQYLLSNNHVLARTDQALAGESIIQPGLIDSNCGQGANNIVGTLTQFYNL